MSQHIWLKFLEIEKILKNKMDLTNMSDPKHLDLVISQAQSSVGLTNMLNPKHLGLVISQA